MKRFLIIAASLVVFALAHKTVEEGAAQTNTQEANPDFIEMPKLTQG
jgi:hypothetical protein